MNARSDLLVLDAVPDDGAIQEAQQQLKQVLTEAYVFAQEQQLSYHGSLPPQTAWQLFHAKLAVIVDVRTHEERKFVGYVPQSLHVPWATGTSFHRNPRFVKELEKVVNKEQVILLLCRSGNRSALAAAAATQAGFKQVYNILEGFEGELNANAQRNQEAGWKSYKLPWKQE